jgi:hypothetical protein
VVLAACGFRHGDLPRFDAGGDTGISDDVRPIDAPADVAAVSCPTGFVAVSGAPAASRYEAFGPQTYATAVMACATMGTHLLRLDTQSEADNLYAFIDTATGTGDTHIYRVVGQRNRNVVPNTWLDLDGVTQLSFLPWGAGEPTSGATEDCMSLRTEADPSLKVIGADVCTTLHEFACECE